MNNIKITICLTDKMHKMAGWIYVHHDISLIQLTRDAFEDTELVKHASWHSVKSFGSGHFRTTLILTPEINKVIKRIAMKKEMSRSAVIRAVLYPHMQKYDPRKKEQKETV